MYYRFIFLLLLSFILVQCGGGGTLVYSDTPDLTHNYTIESRLPGTQAMQTESENYEAVLELGAPVAVVPTDNGFEFLRNHLTFTVGGQ